jgi:hypothetical protein
MTNITLTGQGSYPGHKPDLISRGVISQETAENHFMFYQKYLDPYIHYILADKDCLANVRSRSSLLTAAVCTKAAFCSGSRDYQNCYNVFTNEVSGKMFSVHHTFDDVRALCIGAFWLNDISSALNALGKNRITRAPFPGGEMYLTSNEAVRMAAELNLHRCISKMPHTKRECYERTRLYFMVNICDHHCSLSHGRPPMTRDLRSLKSPRALLQSKFSSPSDLKLISQVELWSISSRVFDILGADIESSFVRNRSAELEQLGAAYDRWRHEWLEVLTLRHRLDEFSRQMFDLYFHSAKLYLFSHVFRGPSQRDLQPPVTANGMDTLAHSAVDSALSIIRCVADGNQTEVWLGRLPFYFGTTIAFASVLLLRASWNAQPIYNVDKDEVFQHLHRLTQLLQGSSIVLHPAHPFLSIATSLEIAMGGRCQSNRDEVDGNEGPYPPFDFDMITKDTFNCNFLGDHDDWMTFPDDIELGLPSLGDSGEGSLGQ